MVSISEEQLYRNLKNKKVYFGLIKALNNKCIYVVKDFYNLLQCEEVYIKKKEELLKKDFKIVDRDLLPRIPSLDRKHTINVFSHV